MITPFEYHQPVGMEEALELLEKLPGPKKVLAGGTDLVLALRRGDISPAHVISLKQLSELKNIHIENGEFHIGALVTFSELAGSPLLNGPHKLLAEAARQVGGPQIRNQGTVGGNIVKASAAGDLLPPLLALNASVRLLRKGGRKDMTLEKFLVEMNKAFIEPDEILSEVVFPILPEQAVSSFVKLGRRNSLAISRLSMAVILLCNEEGLIEDARLTLGAVGPKPIRATLVEEKLKKRHPDPPLLEEAITALSQTVSKNLGNRASEPYKRVAVRGVARKALCDAEPRFGCE